MFRPMLTIILLAVFLPATAFAFSAGSASYNISDAVIATGGNISVSTTYILDMTIGQPVVNYSTGSSYRVYFGRAWQFITSLVNPPESGVRVEDTSIIVTLGQIGKIVIIVSNGASTSKVLPLHIGSFDQSRNWAWFTGHRTDEKRYDLNVTVGPYERRTVTVDFFGAMPGAYKLTIGPDSNYAHRYDEVTIKVVYASKGLFSTTPDIGAMAFALIVLIAAMISVSGRKKEQGLG